MKNKKYLTESLGHIIDEQGLQTLPKRTDALSYAYIPENKTILKSIFCLLTDYIKFIPESVNKLKPLYLHLRCIYSK